MSDPATLERVVTPDTTSVFHLAAVVSGAAESDFDLGKRVNLEGTRLLLEAVRKLPSRRASCSSSSVAAFGGELAGGAGRFDHAQPADLVRRAESDRRVPGDRLSRKGFIDGRSLRLPTIVVRAGQAERGCVVVRERHHPRAAERRGVRMSGRSGDRRVAAVARQGDRGVHSRARAAVLGLGYQSLAQPARHHRECRADGRSACEGGRRSRRGAGLRSRMRASARS